MKRYLNLLIVILFFSIGTSFIACSKEDDVIFESEPENKQENNIENEIIDPETTGSRDFSTLRKAANGSISISYTQSELHLYEKDKNTDNKWAEINIYSYEGWQGVLPQTINIKDGRSWTQYEMFSISRGYNELYMPWYAYCKVTGENKSLYVATPIQLDEEAYAFTMNGETFNILEASDDSFKLSYKSKYAYSDGEVGTEMEVSRYQKSILNDLDESNILWYDSERDLIIDICAKIRNKFGNQFNLNNYLSPEIVLDDPMVDMDKVENALLSRLSD